LKNPTNLCSCRCLSSTVPSDKLRHLDRKRSPQTSVILTEGAAPNLRHLDRSPERARGESNGQSGETPAFRPCSCCCLFSLAPTPKLRHLDRSRSRSGETPAFRFCPCCCLFSLAPTPKLRHLDRRRSRSGETPASRFVLIVALFFPGTSPGGSFFQLHRKGGLPFAESSLPIPVNLHEERATSKTLAEVAEA
jgi:hypothetical protein